MFRVLRDVMSAAGVSTRERDAAKTDRSMHERELEGHERERVLCISVSMALAWTPDLGPGSEPTPLVGD